MWTLLLFLCPRQHLHSVWRSEVIAISGLVGLEWLRVLTPDAEDGGALGPSLRALRRDGVLAHVFGPHSKNQQGTHPAGVGDVVVGVCVQADVISVPGDPRFGVARHRTAHVALVAFGRVVKLQWDDKDWWTLHVTIPVCWRAQHKPLCGGRDKHRKHIFSALRGRSEKPRHTFLFLRPPGGRLSRCGDAHVIFGVDSEVIHPPVHGVADREPVIEEPVGHRGPRAFGGVQFGHRVVEAVIQPLVRRREPGEGHRSGDVFLNFYWSRWPRIICKQTLAI